MSLPAGRAFARAMLLAVVLSAVAPAARAQLATEPGPDGLGNIVKYGTCAGGLAIASTFAQAFAALAFCAKMVADEWHSL